VRRGGSDHRSDRASLLVEEEEMSLESIRDFYNKQYASYTAGALSGHTFLHDAGKARRRVTGVVRGFGIDAWRSGAKVLDVGCGPGYYSRALASTGADVTGVDISEAAIAIAKVAVPGCRFDLAAWPDGIADDQMFDLIWMVNLSLMNTFDIAHINRELVEPALRRLRLGGYLVLGWNSDFSGRMVNGYSQWSIDWLRELRETCGLSAPLVVEVRSVSVSYITIRFARLVKRSVPFFMVRQKRA
jgi:SAM-dependent methyltransferase